MINQALDTFSDMQEMFALKVLVFFFLLSNAHEKFNFSPHI